MANEEDKEDKIKKKDHKAEPAKAEEQAKKLKDKETEKAKPLKSALNLKLKKAEDAGRGPRDPLDLADAQSSTVHDVGEGRRCG